MSSLSWLDTDDAQRRRMLEAIQLFTEHGTIDEIGVGTVRDAFSDLIFPGTSTLHTRLRYLLFVPWILRSVAAEGVSGERAVRLAADREYRLIESLLSDGEQTGVIGSQAKRRLKRLPSLAYWSATWQFGTRQIGNVSTESYLRDSARLLQSSRAERALRYIEADAAPDAPDPLGWHSGLPPQPSGLLKQTTFTLTREEGEYLLERIATHVPGSLLAWLVTKGRPTEVDYVWQHPQLGQFGSGLEEVVDHARRFSIASAGARAMYELMVAEARVQDGENPELLSTPRRLLTEWGQLLKDEKVFIEWDRDRFWHVVASERQISPGTRSFIDTWLDLAAELGGLVAEDDRARSLIAERERRLKGGLARLRNQRAREGYQGSSQLWLLDFRWPVTRRLLDDLYLAIGRTPGDSEGPDHAAT